MKKLIFISLAIIAILSTSCKSDDALVTTNLLVETSWRYDEGDFGYVVLKFISSNKVEYNVFSTEVVFTWVGNYSVKDNIVDITILSPKSEEEEEGDDKIFLNGKIEGNKMTLDYRDGDEDEEPEATYIFKKQ